MGGTSIKEYYFKLLGSIENKILTANKDSILSTDIQELVDYFIGNDAIEPVALLGNPELVEHDRKIADTGVNPNILIERRNGSGRNLGFTFHFHVQPNHNLSKFIRYEGSTYTLDGFESKLKDFGDNCITYEFNFESGDLGREMNAISEKITSVTQKVQKVVGWKNNEVEEENRSLRQRVIAKLEKRRKELAEIDTFMSSVKSISPYKIIETPGAPFRELSIKDKPILKVSSQSTANPIKEYVINEADVIRILDYLDPICHTFEKTPCSFKGLGETDFRGILLASLNGAFQSDATGETFIKNGKTDICIRIDKAQILVFELKLWSGAAAYNLAINQLLGYNTWRQSHGVLITFCRNRNFSDILKGIPNTIQSHNQYHSGFREVKEHYFKSNFSFPEDTGRSIVIHHLFYNIHCQDGLD